MRVVDAAQVVSDDPPTGKWVVDETDRVGQCDTYE
jgi:hypothetical protein